MPRPAARSAWRGAFEELACPPGRPSARRQVGARAGARSFALGVLRRRVAGRGSACGGDADAGRSPAGQAGRRRRSKNRSRDLINIVAPSEAPADLPHIIASGVSTSCRPRSRLSLQDRSAINARPAPKPPRKRWTPPGKLARMRSIRPRRTRRSEARDAIHEEMRGGGQFDQIIAMKATGIYPGICERAPRCPAATSRG